MLFDLRMSKFSLACVLVFSLQSIFVTWKDQEIADLHAKRKRMESFFEAQEHLQKTQLVKKTAEVSIRGFPGLERWQIKI